jgi:hypothetical protein
MGFEANLRHDECVGNCGVALENRRRQRQASLLVARIQPHAPAAGGEGMIIASLILAAVFLAFLWRLGGVVLDW